MRRVHAAVRDERGIALMSAIALIGFMLLQRWRAPPILVVAFCLAAAAAETLAL